MNEELRMQLTQEVIESKECRNENKLFPNTDKLKERISALKEMITKANEFTINEASDIKRVLAGATELLFYYRVNNLQFDGYSKKAYHLAVCCYSKSNGLSSKEGEKHYRQLLNRMVNTPLSDWDTINCRDFD